MLTKVMGKLDQIFSQNPIEAKWLHACGIVSCFHSLQRQQKNTEMLNEPKISQVLSLRWCEGKRMKGSGEDISFCPFTMSICAEKFLFDSFIRSSRPWKGLPFPPSVCWYLLLKSGNQQKKEAKTFLL
jgi:hypothetical protein